MLECDLRPLSNHFAYVYRRLGSLADVRIERRTDRWLATVEWTSEQDQQTHLVGALGPAGEPTPLGAMESLCGRIAQLERYGLT